MGNVTWRTGRRTSVGTQQSRQISIAATKIAAVKMSAGLSWRVAILQDPFRRQNTRSMTVRPW